MGLPSAVQESRSRLDQSFFEIWNLLVAQGIPLHVRTTLQKSSRDNYHPRYTPTLARLCIALL